MRSALGYARPYSKREPSGIEASDALADARPVAIIDIGSNSVRLVIYDGPWRRTSVLHNRKTICALGRNIVRTGRLYPPGTELALNALAQFRLIAAGYGVGAIQAVATAAVRDAQDGTEFVAEAEKILGAPIEVLPGGEEARIAAEGVLAGIPEADGLVADLGGGSLDMVPVSAGRAGEATTLPFGPLRLMDIADGNLKKARTIVAEALDKHEFGGPVRDKALYAVGGIWRALARVDMEDREYPLRVLHHYAIPANRALKLCKVVSGLSRKSLEKMPSVPKRRAEALPYGALVLEQMILNLGLKEIVVSAYGLREGLLQRMLPPAEAAKDPLIEFARDVNARESRSPGHAEVLFEWMSPLFPAEAPAERRLRHAVCLLSDISWRCHPDDRARSAFHQALFGAYAGADHHQRVGIATAVYTRYAGNDEFLRDTGVAGLLNEEQETLSVRIGLAARLAFGLTGSVEAELAAMPLRMTAQSLTLEVPEERRVLLGESAVKKLNDLAKSLGRRAQTLVA